MARAFERPARRVPDSNLRGAVGHEDRTRVSDPQVVDVQGDEFDCGVKQFAGEVHLVGPHEHADRLEPGDRRSDRGEPLYFISHVQDISARKQAEEAAHASEARYRTLVEQASDGIFLANPEGRYIEVNSAGCQLLGYTREEILQRTMRDVTVIPAEAPLRLDELRSGKVFLSERTMIRKDGSRVPVEISAKQLADGRFQGIVRDITERKQAEEERAQLLEREQAARLEAQQAVRLRDQFLSIASHELKTPLTSLFDNAQMFERLQHGSDERLLTRQTAVQS